MSNRAVVSLILAQRRLRKFGRKWDKYGGDKPRCWHAVEQMVHKYWKEQRERYS